MCYGIFITREGSYTWDIKRKGTNWHIIRHLSNIFFKSCGQNHECSRLGDEWAWKHYNGFCKVLRFHPKYWWGLYSICVYLENAAKFLQGQPLHIICDDLHFRVKQTIKKMVIIVSLETYQAIMVEYVQDLLFLLKTTFP